MPRRVNGDAREYHYCGDDGGESSKARRNRNGTTAHNHNNTAADNSRAGGTDTSQLQERTVAAFGSCRRIVAVESYLPVQTNDPFQTRPSADIHL